MVDPRTLKQREIVARIGPEHAKAFARVKSELKSTALGPSVVGDFAELRALLDGLPSLEDAEERCRHVLAVREREAIRKRTLQYFGSAMWKRHNFDKGLSLELADVDGTRDRGGESGLDAAMRIAEGG